MALLHMVTADPLRTPTFVLFARPDYYLSAGSGTCAATGCIAVDPRSAWSHGDVDADITTTWLGLAGRGVRRLGLDRAVWSDHADIRPTMLALCGLRSAYREDGRVLGEVMEGGRLGSDYLRLAGLYKQLNAPVGEVGLASLKAATRAIAGDDAAYSAFLDRLRDYARRREALASRVRDSLEAAAFSERPVDPSLAPQAAKLIGEMRTFS